MRSVLGSFARPLEVLVNLSILAVCAMILLQGWKGLRAGTRSGPKRAVAGTRLAIEGVDWATSKRTLLFALEPGCRFCVESAGFHRALAQRARMLNLRTLALMPGAESDNRSYLLNAGLDIQDVRPMKASGGPLFGTPSIALIDAHGVITKVWIGKLSPHTEQELLAQLTAQGE